MASVEQSEKQTDELHYSGEVFLHVDLDAFFASVEQLDHPEYRGKPVIVGGLPTDRRSVVCTASYEARKFGVHAPIPISQAYRLCPQGIFVRPRINRYHELSTCIMEIFSRYSPEVTQISIDEAFINLTGTERLFGSPVKVAREIKQKVKEATGLTVSVGVASTMYVAKICSGYRKPDGLTVVPEGCETEFMLSLPLSKLWGLGEKSQEHIQSAGFRSTRQLYEKSEQMLQTIFGQNCGSYIYNSLRGNKGLYFGEESKSHSISSETTFDYDLTSTYAMETALLILSQTVMFRMHDLNAHSQTVCLKIRYDDFTTVSIQEKRDQIFTSVEDLYSSALKLFRKKYEDGKGIRLFGLGLHNIEDNSVPVQKSLFDFGEEKKSKVEKAITEMRNKHPEINIQKARSLKCIAVFLLLLPFFMNAKAIAQENSTATTNETEADGAGAVLFSTQALKEPPSVPLNPFRLFDTNINSRNVKLTAKGYWQSSVTSGFSTTFGYNTTPALSASSPVFSQQVDLNFTFLLDNRFYFETIFADGFEKNTIGGGYKGDGFLKHARVANRNIIFPDYYSSSKTGLNPGGGTNEAPGLSLHFENEKIKSDFLLRYETLCTQTREYNGLNSVTRQTQQMYSYRYGRRFILPDEDCVKAVTAVYVESINGTVTGSDGKKYRLLSASQYLLQPGECCVLLSSDSGSDISNGKIPSVAFAIDSSFKTTLKEKLGAYGTSQTPGTGFLGETQKYFNSRNNENTELYRYGFNAKDSSECFFTTIEGHEVLYAAFTDCFSPFCDCSTYRKYYTSATAALVLHSAAGTAEPSMNVEEKEDLLFMNDEMNYGTERYFVVSNNNYSSQNKVHPSQRFPLADSNPLYYLVKDSTRFASDFSYDLVLETRTYSKVSGYNIGNDAVNGTVMLYVNGILDAGAVYSSENGTVTPSVHVGENDKVKITWSQDSASAANGAVAAAAGVSWNITDTWIADASFTSRWSVSPSQDFSDTNQSLPGFAAVTAGVNYNENGIDFSSTISTSVKTDNTTNLKRMLSMDSVNQKDIYLTKQSLVQLPENFAPCLNMKDSSSIELDPQYQSPDTTTEAQTDSAISGWKVPVSWNIKGKSEDENLYWNGATINLSSQGYSLWGAKTFSIALKEETITNQNYSVYLQLGVSSSDSFTYEDRQRVPTWCISKSGEAQSNATSVQYAFVPSKDSSQASTAATTKSLGSGWQQVTVSISDEDRSFLTANTNARIIITTDIKDSECCKENILWVGPCSMEGDYFKTEYDNENFTLFRESLKDSSNSSSTVSRFNSGTTNEIQDILWNMPMAGTEQCPVQDDKGLITISRPFTKTNLEDYRKINFFFKYNASKKITPVETVTTTYEKAIYFELLETKGTAQSSCQAVHAELSFDELEGPGSGWHLVTIDLAEQKLYVDSNYDEKASSTLFINVNAEPDVFQLKVNTICSEKNYFISQGDIGLDEFFFSDATLSFNALNYSNFSCTSKELFRINDQAVFKDFTFSASENTGVTVKDKAYGFSSGNAKLSFTTLGIKCSADSAASWSSRGTKNATASSDAENVTGLTTAGYSFSNAMPFFNALDFSHSARANALNESGSQESMISVNLKKFSIPLVMTIKNNAELSLWENRQTVNTLLSYDGKYYGFKLNATQTQKLSSQDESSTPQNILAEEYKTAFSTGSSQAQNRTVSCTLANGFKIPAASLSPQLEINEKKTSSADGSTSTLSLDLKAPFKINSVNITTGYRKTAVLKDQISVNEENSSYFTDYQSLSGSVTRSSWIFTCPIYDFASDALKEQMKSNCQEINLTSASYNSKIYLNLSRQMSASMLDLILPAAMDLSMERSIDVSENAADANIVKATMYWTSINMLGKNSAAKIFSWYEQEALSGSVSAGLKIDRTQNNLSQAVFNGYLQNDFYIRQGSTLKMAADGYYEDKCDWNFRTICSWERNVKQSPAGSLALLIYPKLNKDAFSFTRTSSLQYTISKTSTGTTTDSTQKLTTSLSLSHQIEAQLTENLSVNGGITSGFSVTPDTVMSLNAEGTLGFKLLF